MNSSDAGIVQLPGQGKSLGMSSGGGQTVIKADGEDTRGGYAILEDTLPANSPGTPLHVHRHTDEGFYILIGSLTFVLGARKVVAPAGTYVFIPRGVHHALLNPAAELCRFLIILSPPGFEKYFEELAELGRRTSHRPLDVGAVASIARKHDMEVVGPRQPP